MAPPSGRHRDDDEAPWLAEVESDGHTSTLVPRGRFIGGVTLFVLLLLLVVIGIYFIAQTKQDGATGTPVERAEDAPLIAAEPGPYKVKPADPGGLKVPGFKDTMHCISEGNCPEPVDINGPMPEEPGPRPGEAPVELLPPGDELPAIPPAAPVARPAAPAAPVVSAPKPTVAVPPVATVPPRPKPGASTTVPLVKATVAAPPRPVPAPAATPASGGTTLQLGAFSSASKAEQAWKSLSTRFAYLAPLSKRIEPVERDTGTLYRLRASGSPDAAAATQTCAKLKVAGETCAVVK
jgi:cell division septation protein DedD